MVKHRQSPALLFAAAMCWPSPARHDPNVKLTAPAVRPGDKHLFKTLVLVLASIIGTVLLIAVPSGSASRAGIDPLPAQVKPTPRGLSDAEKRGRAFYLRGESSTGQELIAMIGEIDVPASTVTCAGCHGNRGEGKTEGGVTAGNLTWTFLTKPYGHTDDGGRKHPAFAEGSFIRAVTSGIDPAGNKVSVAMPTYRMPQQDMADLIAYLKRIETDTDPGISDTRLVIGTLLPDKGPLAGMSQSMREILQAYFAEINSRGGLYNRQIELRITNSETSTLLNMKRLVEAEEVFAMVSGLTAGADQEVSAFSQKEEVPFIGPSTLLPQRSSPVNRYVFYLLPGLKEQAKALVSTAAKRLEPPKQKVAIICPNANLNRQIATVIGEQLRKENWASVSENYYSRESFNAERQVAALKEQGINTIFLLSPAGDAATLFKAVAAAGWSPSIYLLGSLADGNIVEAIPPSLKDRIFLAFPTVPTNISAAAGAEYGALLEKYKLRPSHTAAQLSALAAAKILVHALERSGKDLSRERLVTTLEGLYEFESGLTPAITFGPNRRIGSLGAYIVTVDPEKKLFPATAEWVSAD